MKYNWKKNTIIFMLSQAISLLGSSLVQFAITSYITIETQSGVYASISIICAILPMFVVAPFAGVWADKYSRKTLIIIADTGISICTLIVAILFLTGYGSIPILLIALVIRSIGSAVQTPCVGAILPDIVPEEHLIRINGINGSMQALFGLASPILGALLLSKVSLGAIFFVDIGTAIVAIVVMLVAFILPKKENEGQTSENYFQEMKLGIRYIKKTRFLIEFFAFCIIYFIMMAPAAFLTQVQIARNYGGGYRNLAIMQVAFSMGMLIGGITISVWGGLKNKVHTMVLSAAAIGICTFVLGIQMPFLIYCICMGIFGVAMPFINTPAMTLLQEQVEPQYIGRVFGIMTMINTSMMPLGMVIFGPLGDMISIEIILIITGIIMLITALSMTKAKELCRVGAKNK